MVKGLELFRAHFASFSDRYVLIGGTACDIAMAEAGLPFRATKDLDIVLVVEALDGTFVAAFWDFIRAGKYQAQEKSTGERQFYRFHRPENAEYPQMLELFSRAPDVLQPAPDSHLTPLPVEEEVSSLSAILMDDEYYAGQSRARVVGGLPLPGLLALRHGQSAVLRGYGHLPAANEQRPTVVDIQVPPIVQQMASRGRNATDGK